MKDRWQTFDVAVGAWRLGELPAEQLPAAAVQALTAGCEAPSLGQLAAMEGLGWSEIEPVLTRVFEERERSLPDEYEAVKLVADGLLGRLVAGELEPEVAASQLGTLSWKVEGREAWDDLWVFQSWWSSWVTAAQGYLDPEEVRRGIVEEGRKLLMRGGVRVG